MRFIITCGGTAGHINPGLAVAGKLRSIFPDCEILFVGADGHMEENLVPREGYEIKTVHISSISRGHSLAAIAHNVDTLKNVAVATAQSRSIMKDFKPDAVIGTGGYVCYPVLHAAHKLHIPTAVHESNALPGLTTKMLAREVDKIMVGFEESKKYYPDPGKVVVTGTPVRGEFGCYTRESAKAELGLKVDTPLLLAVFGSLGAGHMNEVMLDFIPLMKDGAPFHLEHSIGRRYYEEFREKLLSRVPDYASYGANEREYIYDMPRVMAAADLIICRAGASTLSELTYLGKPAILVPSPNVAENHQEKNARVLEKAGGAKVLLEGEFDAKSLYELVCSLISDETKLEEMSKAMRSLGAVDATDRICAQILGLVE